jgi:Phage gp6-like head-tail connector protein
MADPIDLLLLDDVKDWLGITDTKSDTLLARLITAQSNYIKQWLQRDIVATSYVNEQYNGNGLSALMLRNWPLLGVSSITVTDTSGISSAYTAADVYFDRRNVFFNDSNNSFAKGLGNVSISYQAGFVTTPPAIAQAAIELIAMRYKERDRVGHQSKQVQGDTVSFITKDMPDSVKTLLKQFRNVVPL